MFRYFVAFHTDRGIMNGIVSRPRQIYSRADVDNVEEYLAKSTTPPLARVVLISFNEIRYRVPSKNKKP
jgi:hypothetical protein